MLPQQRHERILAELRRAGAVRVSDLTHLLGVSDMTVRRDLEELAATGVARKVHGGAVLATQTAHEPGFVAKSEVEPTAKNAIAAAAVELIKPGAAIALSAGTTTWCMARLLVTVPGLTVLTNSSTVAEAIAEIDPGNQVNLILTGGVRTPSAALVGPVADRTIAAMHVDQLFLGVHGMDEHVGFTTPNLAEAATNRALIGSARQVIVLADSSKWGVVGLADIAPLAAAHTVITDDKLSHAAARSLRDQVGDVIMAPVPDHATDHSGR
jgi:DeoR/GlpR family transcriptional regulator of sugar metabolism